MTMSSSSQFDAFRIHNDADGYRSGLESIALADLNDGEVVQPLSVPSTASSAIPASHLSATGAARRSAAV